MFYQRYGTKYNSRRTEYHGTSYMSKKEAQKAYDLDLLVKAGEIKSWTKQVKLSLDVNGVHIANYFMDFIIEENDGSFTCLETKGYETDVWRMKWRLAQALYGDVYKFILEK